MGLFESKDAVIILIGLVGSILLGFIFKLEKFDLNKFTPIDLIIILTIAVISIIFIVYLKMGEINKELDNQKIEQQKLSEKLKIHEQLIGMKAEINELQKKVFKK